MGCSKEVISELLPLVKVYSDGSVERLMGSPFVEPTPEDIATGVSSKDIVLSVPNINNNISARLYLPKKLSQSQITSPNRKLPILVYFHGGAFCIESAFSLLHHRYLNRLVSQAGVLAISVEFRQAPEHPLPAAYEDSWTTLRWLSSHLDLDDHPLDNDREPWLLDHGDFQRVYLAGDATGANIAHNTLLRAGSESLPGELNILGAIISLPVFWGSTPIRSEAAKGHLEHMICRVWAFVYPSAPGGIDNPMINPFGAGSPSLRGLGCSRLLVCVAEKDSCRERGIHYFDAVKHSGWGGQVLDLYEAIGAGHGFHIIDPESDMSKNMIHKFSSFLNSQ